MSAAAQRFPLRCLRRLLLAPALLACAGTVAAVSLPSCPQPAGGLESVDVVIPATQRWQRTGVAPGGANALYFSEDDAFWAGADAGLRGAAVTSLRFPGGEVADNYDWRRNALDRPSVWPGEPGDETGRQRRTDYLEFLARARQLGVNDLYFVVNVDSAVRAGGDRDANLLAGARRAADWVRAVNAHGYRVPRWEIGNEPYLTTGYPLSVTEYAAAVKVYAREMRAADPTIKLGVAGPWKFRETAFADTLSTEQLALMRAHGSDMRGYCPTGKPRDCRARLAAAKPGKARNLPWWPTLVREVGDSIDFVVTHRYARTEFSLAGMLELSRQLRDLRGALEPALGRPVPVAVTEWNLPGLAAGRTYDAATHLLDIGVQYGNLLAGGADAAHFWPTSARAEKFRALLAKDGAMLPPAQLFALYAAIRPDDEVAQFVPAAGIYVLAWRAPAGGREGMMIVNTLAKAVSVRLPFSSDAATARVVALAAGRPSPAAPCAAARERFTYAVPVKGRTVARVETVPGEWE